MTKTVAIVGLALAMGWMAGPAWAADAQPPMDSFDEAFYTCQGDHNFLITYDSDTPTAATLTTNGDNKAYALKRAGGPGGVTFAGDGVKFWTDGSSTTVDGAAIHLQACKRKAS